MSVLFIVLFFFTQERKIMKIEKFVSLIEEKLQQKMGDNVKIRTQKVRKNNNVVYYGVIIQEVGQNIAPTIYVNSFYEMYCGGADMEMVLKGIMDTYENGRVKESIDMEFFCDFDKVKDRIAYRLISAERNKELLEQIPHILFMDLAICFYYAFYQDELGDGMILIHNSHMEMWGTNHRELMKLAEENTKRMFPPCIVSMKELIEELFEKETDPGLYVVTNEKKTQGAVAMLNQELLEQAAEKLGGSFFVLPSSIHEVILLKDRGCEVPQQLREMILEANRTQVAEEEILSDWPYYYDSKEKKLTILNDILQSEKS